MNDSKLDMNLPYGTIAYMNGLQYIKAHDKWVLLNNNHSADITLLFKAKHFAKKAHINQVRRYTNEPYFNHCEELVDILFSYGITDPNILASAYLHDTVEDTDTTIEQIQELFGDDIAYIVNGLTDKANLSDGNRATRKQINIEHISKFDYRVHTVKLVDIISNSKSIIEHDKKFAKVYMEEIKELIKVLQSDNDKLMLDVLEIINNWDNK